MSRSRSDPRRPAAAIAALVVALVAPATALADADIRAVPARVGAGSTLEVVIQNAGPDAAEPVAVVVRIPGAEVEPVVGGPLQTCTFGGDTATCVQASVPVQAAPETFFTVRVRYPVTGTYEAVTEVSTGSTDPDPSNNTATVRFTGVAPTAAPLPAPVQGRLVNASRVSGVVRVRRPGGRFVVLTEGSQIPVGSTVDVTRGRVRLESARRGTARNVAEFYLGRFVVRQRRGASLTQLFLQGGDLAACPRRSAAAAELQRRRPRKPVPRRLWGKGEGDYQTVGRNSSTTVRGTLWLVEDRCDGTFTRVTQGRVAVRDFVRRRTVLLRAPQTYLARRP